MKDLYSTRELAELLSVNESTVKRWADNGFIECSKIKGGHRKFPAKSVLKFVHENKIQGTSLSISELDKKDVQAHLIAGFVDVLVQPLKDAALSGDSFQVERIVQAGFISLPDLVPMYTQLVFPALVEIGSDWENGSIGVDREHLATQAIRAALVRFQSGVHVKEPNGLSAVVACYASEVHDVAITCVASYLISEGWRVYQLGQDIPTKDLVEFIRYKKPDLVAISADIVDDERKFVHDINDKIVPYSKKVRAKTVVGGRRIKDDFSHRLKCNFLSDNISDIVHIHESTLGQNIPAAVSKN